MASKRLRSALLCSAIGCGLVLAACSSGDDDRTGSGQVFENAGGRYTVARLSISIPDGWHSTSKNFTALGYPTELATVTSFPVRPTGPPQSCSPEDVLNQLPRSGIAISLREYRRRYLTPKDLDNVALRPAHLRLGPRQRGSFDCFSTSGTVAQHYVISFKDRGRAFQLLVAIGRDAIPETRRLALRTIDSIQVERR